ncbi:helix-turn-helix domain-containing protein [Piscibacillus sp. B03]|uniref:helix-turn-helix domain-containing protein n=1 Tax=Piscibacillus sp. B03 TaxID=3457430 RepID=UPI003FCD9352
MAERSKRQSYDFDLKKEVVQEYFNGVSSTELVEKYGLNSRRRVSDWVSKVRDGGYEALYRQKRGPKSTDDAEESELEKLKKQNKSLELEIMYLKKLMDLKRR